MPLKNYKLYVADGFSNDCDTLIRNCLEGDRKVTYPIFCEVWKEMNFGCLYQGRNIIADIAELSEEVIQVAKEFLFIDTDTFEELVAALFLVYGLVKLQPYPNFAALRLCPENIEGIQRIEARARKENRLDVLFILGSLLTEAQFHAESRERGMEWTLRKYFDGNSRYQDPRSSGVLHRQNKIHQLLKEMSNLSEEYVQLKMQLQGFPNGSLNFWDAAFPRKIATSLNMLMNCNSGDSTQADSRSGSIKILTSRLNEDSGVRTVNAVREKAMKSVVNPMRHLVAVHERVRGRRKLEELEDTTKKLKSSTDDRKVKKSKRNKLAIAENDETKDDIVEKTERNDVVIEFIDEGNKSGLPDLNAIGLLDVPNKLPDLTGADVTVETPNNDVTVETSDNDVTVETPDKQNDDQMMPIENFKVIKRSARIKKKSSLLKETRAKNT